MLNPKIMCGRFALAHDGQSLCSALNDTGITAHRAADFSPCYNYAPQASIPALVYSRKRQRLELHLFEWGFSSVWDDKPQLLINARSESAAEKPTFREAWQKRRCIIPASGFYEWQARTPYFVKPERQALFFFAALWQTSREVAESELTISCVILTLDAPPNLAAIHHRAPATIAPEHISAWLGNEAHDTSLLTPPQAIYHQVDKEVNNARNNHQGLMQESVPPLI